MIRFCALAASLLIGSCAPYNQQLANIPKFSTIAIAGDRLAYVEAGRGAPLLLIHGGFQDYRMWLPHLPAFADKRRVITYSRRNHFPNQMDSAGTPDFAADRHGADIAQLVHALRLEPLDLVAHSSGASTALFFAAQNPGLVRSVVLVEPPVVSMLTDSAADQLALNQFSLGLGQALTALRNRDDSAAVRLFADAVGGAGTYARRTPAQKSMMLDNIAAHVADAVSKQPRPKFTCEMARTIRAPVLLINGNRSPTVFHRIVERLSRCLPRAQRLTIASSHTVPSENPRAFQEAVINFLDAQPTR